MKLIHVLKGTSLICIEIDVGNQPVRRVLVLSHQRVLNHALAVGLPRSLKLCGVEEEVVAFLLEVRLGKLHQLAPGSLRLLEVLDGHKSRSGVAGD